MDKKAKDRAYYEANRERIKSQARAYHAANREACLAQSKRYRKVNAERLKQVAAQWQRDNTDKVAARNSRWKKAHREQVNESQRRRYAANPKRGVQRALRYQQEYPHKKQEHDHNYRARKVAAFVETVDPRAIYSRDKGLCGICRRKVMRSEMTLDHIAPLSRGGQHRSTNIQLAHFGCNARKGNRGVGQPLLV